ncbi:conserved hypothetical protein [Candidatus Desulfarcum epimagneticum]|uniref:ATPase domain-containing protein n=1 Tax=uncultured Desulfobacteraceae bacterium TaxID=218296 RepID=A0A484HD96_9BACT|nr:conserved hypothetical protein [uncultured Desulfobacteraceae bacterium]
MRIYLKEKIGSPALFTGRKRELDSLLKWVEGIKPEISKSKAIISRRKTGKSAVMQRLFNIVFEQNDQVVPFYFEIRETPQWIGDFAREFFFTFISQYIAFKSRSHEYLNYTNDYDTLIEAAKKEGLDFLVKRIEHFESQEKREYFDTLWHTAREAPRAIAQRKDERVLQMIDEFQFINRYIYWDKKKERRASDLAGSYLHTAEYKNAPLLVSGSWVGWLMDDLQKMLPGRFTIFDFGNMPKNEAVEMALNYSEIEQVPITHETARIMADLTEGNPFYISSLFQSEYPDKDFSTQKGILEVLDFETMDKRGGVRGTWMEYIHSATDRINDANGKRIILYICKRRKATRDEIRNDLELSMTDRELEKRLKAFVRSDIIEQGTSNFDYQAVADNIFDKVFRGRYQKEIDGFTPEKIKDEYRVLYKKLQGEYNKYKGEFSEYVIMNHLKHRAYKQNDLYMSMMSNLPDDFEFVEYSTLWSYSASPAHKKDIQVDVFAQAGDDAYSLIGEVKNRKKKFSLTEARAFFAKASEVQTLEDISKTLVFVFSASGFYKTAIDFFVANGMAWSADKRFLE